MKLKNIVRLASVVALGATISGCNDYLDIMPPSEISPEQYLTTAEQLGTYTIPYYNGSFNGGRGSNMFPHHGIGGNSYESYFDGDKGTDNEDGVDSRFFNGTSKVKVGNEGGSWYFNTLNSLNWFIKTVRERQAAGKIKGAEAIANHYLGEAYMLRATENFGKLRALGDFPIYTYVEPAMDKDYLIRISKRAPRNVFARHILADMDTAISLLSDGSLTGKRNRITKDAALLFRARVALFEGTFEKYFAGTPFVPDAAAGWPGAKKDYNKDFTYDNAKEVAFFLDEAMKSAKAVADAHPKLASNNKKLKGKKSGVDGFPANEYYDMFASQDVSKIDEALMYRSYDLTAGGGHCMNQYIRGGRGFTQEFANTFLMENGLPIYADGSGYAGDDFIADTQKGRDYRWQLFVKAPNDYIYEDNLDQRVGCGKKNKKDAEFKAPGVGNNGGVDCTTSTGYQKGKGWAQISDYSRGGHDLCAAIVFRAAEAYLIYIEACCERKGDALDSDAKAYWAALRKRAGLPEDYMVTVNATDLAKEEETSHDFGLYSAGAPLTSKVLYNIRRERRCELMGEGMRMDDLIRWRALDQLKTKRAYTHGCKIFGPMYEWMTGVKKADAYNGWATKNLVFDNADPNKNNISSPSDVEGGFNGDPRYMNLQRTSSMSEWYESGFSWRMAHYLWPINEDHFVQTAPSGDLNDSPIYQNPYWGMIHDTPAEL